ncbi:hypothetical protein ACOCEA_00390 [Maribacter sp. CXY002]|uniref:hypothetical protein n=1 Tax=Maribacter luteocoastalis TaxID=3407671 RepID=UPI003B68520C
MGKRLRIGIISFFVSLSFAWSSLPISENLWENATIGCIDTLENNPIGVWEYTVFGAEAPYEKGVLFVENNNGAHKVDIQLSNGTLTGQDVEVRENTIKFNMNIEGMERVSVVLWVSNDDISGEAYSNQGTFKIQGKRKLPEYKQ